MSQGSNLNQDSVRKTAKDTTSTYGVRGAGVSWQASFGMPLSEADLLFAVRREPVANRIVFQVAHDIFDNWFKVEEVSDKPDGSFDREVQKVLSALNAKAIFTQFAVYERLFGWAIIAISYVDYGKGLDAPVSNPREIIELFPFSTLQFSVQSSDEDTDTESSRFGLPIYYTLRRDRAGQSKLHFTRVIHGATRLLDHPYKGMSVLEPVYDDLTVLRNIRWGLGQTIYRYGSGFPDVEVKGAKRKQLDDLEASQQFRNLQARTYFLHSDDTKLDFKGVAGKALDPEPYYTPIMENIAAGSGLPLAILRGAQAGALTGSEVNEREYFKIISDAQSRYEPCIRQLIDALLDCGQIRFKYNVQREYRIVWNSGFELTEKDKASIELQQAQARNLKTGWMSVDEVRAEQGLEALPNNTGLVVLGLEKNNPRDPLQSPSSQVDSDEGLLKSLLNKIRRAKDT
jgi:phage-related protein (TIGR01555 family)